MTVARSPVPPLSLLQGGLSEPIDEWELGLSVLHRPGELIEPVAVDASTTQRINDLASSAQIPAPMAFGLVVELHLALSDLQRYGASGYVAVLDKLATQARPARSMSARTGDYLRVLNSGRRDAPGSRSPLGLPARIARRASADLLCAAVDGADLPRARAWERAAVIEGRTLTEWALALALRAGQAGLAPTAEPVAALAHAVPRRR